MSLRVGIVCPEQRLRMSAARAFDAAPAEWDISFSAEPDEEADVLVAVGVSLPGAVSMDPSDPEAVIDRIRQRYSQSRRLIVVIGASGGCGATSIALHLAAAWRDGGVAVVDLHRGAPAALRLGIADAGIDADIDPVVLPVAGGFRLVFPRDASQGIVRVPQVAFEHAGTVIVDAPPEAVGCLETRADRVVLVMTPTVPSATRAELLLGSDPEQVWVPVTNRVGPGSETTRLDIERILGRRIALELPCSPGLRDAEDELKLLTSSLSPWRLRVQRLADAL